MTKTKVKTRAVPAAGISDVLCQTIEDRRKVPRTRISITIGNDLAVYLENLIAQLPAGGRARMLSRMVDACIAKALGGSES